MWAYFLNEFLFAMSLLLGLWECRLNHMKYFLGLVKQMIKPVCFLRGLEKFFLQFMKILFQTRLGIQTQLLSVITFLHSNRNQRLQCVAFENPIPLFLSENSFDFWSERLCYYKVQRPCYSKIQTPSI